MTTHRREGGHPPKTALRGSGVAVHGHVETIDVGVGQRVAAGEQIATTGSRGQSGPHLPFEVVQDGPRST
ncbi:peptidoglycan DD-metalloendopeptidase family protein [Saccharopolyspora rosea]|uniref:Peptidoglycan DD-metalloendopeptidase family protein n=1 Tax=Saccharopolyspora rosea TaxID=524884 RepID=A0ABW3G3B7_9PSEU|nr:M23 family metallopeptidase [Saccharopolyspora rosea]